MIEQMGELAKQIANLPGTRSKLTTFDSGAAMLDVWRDNRLFVMAYTPSWNGYGVDEVLDDEGLLEKYDFFSESFERAAEHLLALVKGTGDQCGATRCNEAPNKKVEIPSGASLGGVENELTMP